MLGRVARVDRLFGAASSSLQDPKDAMLREFQDELERLRAEAAGLGTESKEVRHPAETRIIHHNEYHRHDDDDGDEQQQPQQQQDGAAAGWSSSSSSISVAIQTKTCCARVHCVSGSAEFELPGSAGGRGERGRAVEGGGRGREGEDPEAVRMLPLPCVSTVLAAEAVSYLAVLRYAADAAKREAAAVRLREQNAAGADQGCCGHSPCSNYGLPSTHNGPNRLGLWPACGGEGPEG